jgi:hypothetical protein
MTTTCLNCGKEVTGKYCSHCGQKITVGRLSWHHIGEEIAHFFTHIDHGFLKTTKELLTQPGLLQKNYLDGQRKNYHKPISYMLIWIAVFLLVSGLVKRFAHFENEASSTFLSVSPEIDEMIYKYMTLIEVLILPFTSFNLWLQLGRPRLSYLEILVTGFYRFSVLYIFLTVEYLLGWIFSFNPDSPAALYTMAIIMSAWTAYVFYDFFKRYTIKYLLVRIFTTLVTGVTIYSFLRTQFAKFFIAFGL